MNKQNEKLICIICGGKYTRTNKSKHIKSKKHLLMLEINKLMDIYEK